MTASQETTADELAPARALVLRASGVVEELKSIDFEVLSMAECEAIDDGESALKALPTLLNAIARLEQELEFERTAKAMGYEATRRIAERCGYDTTRPPPEGVYTAVRVVDEYCTALEADKKRIEEIERRSLSLHCNFIGGAEAWSVTDHQTTLGASDDVVYHGADARAALDQSMGG